MAQFLTYTQTEPLTLRLLLCNRWDDDDHTAHRDRRHGDPPGHQGSGSEDRNRGSHRHKENWKVLRSLNMELFRGSGMVRNHFQAVSWLKRVCFRLSTHEIFMFSYESVGVRFCNKKISASCVINRRREGSSGARLLSLLQIAATVLLLAQGSFQHSFSPTLC